MSLYGGPGQPASQGRAWYLPEIYWVDDDFPFTEAFAVTALYAARWATEYAAQRSVLPEGLLDPSTGRLTGPPPRESQSGLLPADDQARRALVKGLLEWMEGNDGAYVIGSDLALKAGGAYILKADGDDSPVGALHLTPEQYASMQEGWRAHGLPEDLYFPESAQRMVMEADAYEGADPEVIRPRYYSPRTLERRAAVGIPPPEGLGD